MLHEIGAPKDFYKCRRQEAFSPEKTTVPVVTDQDFSGPVARNG